jgi:broad specificity phosphatase PhoE
MYTIYIIRHGETDNNKKRVLQGRSNLPLNEEGVRQAEKARDFFDGNEIMFDKIYSSPLIRAIRTAEIITGDAASFILDDQLLEMDYGPYEGMDLNDPAPEVMAFFRDFAGTPAPDGMEPLPAIVKRLGAFLEEIAEEAERHNILISTHAIAMKGALEYLTPESKGSYWAKNIGNCDIYAAEAKGGKFSVPVLIEDGKDRWEGAE